MRLKALLTAVVCCFVLGGCGNITDEIPQKEEVLEFVAKAVTDEKYEFDRVESEPNAKPQKDTYYFKSKERDFEFTAVSTLSAIGIDASTMGYKPYIYSNYATCVKEQYKDEIESILKEIPIDSYKHYCYTSYEELKGIVEVIIKADEVYRQELEYNTAEWLKENPVKRVSLVYSYTTDSGNETFVATCGADLDGSLKFDEVYDKFCKSHKAILKDNGIEE